MNLNSRQLWIGLGSLMVLLLGGWTTAVALRVDPLGTPPAVSLDTVGSSFSQPLGIAHTGMPEDERLFIVEKEGTIKILRPDGSINPTPFFSLTSDFSTENERGLLGLAFHPQYAQNGRFFVYYTRADGDLRISEFAVSTDPDVADPASETIMLEIEHSSQSNHNGGDMHFGPDGYLYAAIGDGGGGGDTENNAQNTGNLLGALLRIDVDGGGVAPDCGRVGNYTIPSDNPFVGVGGACNEIWAYGLRNPWRMSFDPQTGDLFIGDVGQGQREEVNFQPASSPGGENYGWRCYEGELIFNDSLCDLSDPFVEPIFTYPRSEGTSVTGGRVYRGHHFPDMVGYYFVMDYGSGQTWALSPDGGGGWNIDPAADFGVSVVGFGVDQHGDIYVTDIAGGTVNRLQEEYGLQIEVAAPLFVVDSETLTYTLTVTNLGTETLNNVTVSNPLPAGATYVSGGSLVGSTVEFDISSLAAGATTNLEFGVTLDQTVVNAGVEATADEFSGVVPADNSPQTLYFASLNELFLPIVLD